MKRILSVALLMLITTHTQAQRTRAFADSIRLAYNIPELAYAVTSADSVFEMAVTGVRKKNTHSTAKLTDRFRIGSNTKAITGFLAAQLIKEGKLSWDTKFFDLFPELKQNARKEYHELTLLNMLTFRTRLIKYTYTDAKPTKADIKGKNELQQYEFAKWFFAQPPVVTTDSVCFSNLGYVAAGLMLEKASGKTYSELVKGLSDELGADFEIGQPNNKDINQTWGHNASLTPQPPADNYKLNWLLAAGNINATLPGYAKFIQEQLKGLQGTSTLLTKDDFTFLHYGRSRFACGWFQGMDEHNGRYSYNVGNPGTFLTKVYVYNDIDKAFVVFANAQTNDADAGLNALLEELKRKYSK